MVSSPLTRSGTADAILACAEELLEAHGPSGVTTRAVCKAARVTAPTFYHHFGDKDGLLAAIVRRGLESFAARKRALKSTGNAVSDLRQGWMDFIGFAVRRPQLFRLMIDQVLAHPELAAESHAVLRTRIERVAESGQLRVDPDLAMRLMQAASNGVLLLHAQGASRRDIEEAGTVMFDAVAAQILNAESP